jgi:serine/threonine protein kinase
MLSVESSNLLQPENILLASKAPETLIKVADFGVSKILTPGTQMDTGVGTLYYKAPEILDTPHTYTKQVDIWSMGILLYFWYVHSALTEFVAFTVTVCIEVFSGDEPCGNVVSIQFSRQFLPSSPGVEVNIERYPPHSGHCFQGGPHSDIILYMTSKVAVCILAM